MCVARCCLPLVRFLFSGSFSLLGRGVVCAWLLLSSHRFGSDDCLFGEASFIRLAFYCLRSGERANYLNYQVAIVESARTSFLHLP